MLGPHVGAQLSTHTIYKKVSYIAEPFAMEQTDPVVQIQLLHVVVLGPHVGAQLPTHRKYIKVSHIAETFAAERTDPVVQIQLLHVVVLGPHVGTQLCTHKIYKGWSLLKRLLQIGQIPWYRSSFCMLWRLVLMWALSCQHTK